MGISLIHNILAENNCKRLELFIYIGKFLPSLAADPLPHLPLRQI